MTDQPPAQPDNPLVRFVDIQKSYDGVTLVVKSLNLEVARGEFLTMLGPSGSGKTTCLMMLAGFEPATHGEIYLNQVGINKVAPHKRGIGMVFQNYALFPHMTVSENLAREQMQYEIKHIHENLGLTVVYVTHDQSEALTMSNRIAVFDDGVIQQCAPPEVLYEKPENAFCANFIGENNRLRGEVVEDLGDSVKVAVDDGTGGNGNGAGRNIVAALKVKVDGVGGRATLSLRPERVVVSPPENSLPNIFEARAEELIYLGDHIRTRFTVCGHDDFIVKIPNSAAHAHLREGETVRIGWSAEDCRALDPSD